MVVRRIIDIAGQLVLLDPSDAMHQAGCARLDPGASALPVPFVGQEILAVVGLIEEFDRERREIGRIRHLPRFGGISDVTVGQQHNRGHVLHRDPAGLDRAFESIARAAGGDHRHRCIAIAAIDRLIEIALLGLGRQAGGRAAALRIDDDQRQFSHDGKAHRLALERDAGTRRGGYAETAGIARADGGTDRGNLVFRLEGGDVEFLEPCQMMQDRTGRRDRIATEEHRQFGKLRACDEAEADGFGTGDGPVETGVAGHRFDMKLFKRAGQFRRFAIGMARVERGDIGVGNIGLGLELAPQPVVDRLARAIEHPQGKAERPHVL